MPERNEIVDPSSWVDEYADQLYNYAVVRVNDHDLALDLVQETFISGLKSLQNFKGNSTVKTWLYSILKRKIIDYWRQQESRKTKPESHFFSEEGLKGHWLETAGPKGKFSEIEADLENEELGLAIKACIENLPDKWKGVVIDKLVMEEETELVCKEHEISTTNLWVIIHRAKLQLRDCLEKKWFNS